jgi:hydrogenase/urease accessory protein HupE
MRAPRIILLCLGLLAGLVALAPSAAAHPMAPALLELRELEDGHAQVRWKAARLLPRGTRLAPRLPADCPVTDQRIQEDNQSSSLIWTIDCADTPLVGQALSVDGLETAPIDVLVRVSLRDGRTYSRILDSATPGLTIPARQSKWRVAQDYAALGLKHILTGPDHLLFVLGLLLLVASTRSLVRVITAFTLGHSVTLSIVALGYADVPTLAIEFLIALSVLLLAVELARDDSRLEAGKPSGWMRRWPWLMAASFGLLHGMGFAGALADVGLPGEEIPLALFSFNIGIEAGQLSFVLGISLLRRILQAQLDALPPWLGALPAYGIGILAAYWCYERAAEMLGLA